MRVQVHREQVRARDARWTLLLRGLLLRGGRTGAGRLEWFDMSNAMLYYAMRCDAAD